MWTRIDYPRLRKLAALEKEIELAATPQAGEARLSWRQIEAIAQIVLREVWPEESYE